MYVMESLLVVVWKTERGIFFVEIDCEAKRVFESNIKKTIGNVSSTIYQSDQTKHYCSQKYKLQLEN